MDDRVWRGFLLAETDASPTEGNRSLDTRSGLSGLGGGKRRSGKAKSNMLHSGNGSAIRIGRRMEEGLYSWRAESGRKGGKDLERKSHKVGSIWRPLPESRNQPRPQVRWPRVWDLIEQENAVTLQSTVGR